MPKPLQVSIKGKIRDILMSRIIVNQQTGCWEWQKYIYRDGYGRIDINRDRLLAHRVSYQVFVGKIRKGFHVHHCCQIKHCINPDHLKAISPREHLLCGNTLVAKNVKKTHCPKGHPYSGKNLYRYKNQRGCRICRIAHCNNRRRGD